MSKKIVMPAPKVLREFFGDLASENRVKPFTDEETAEMDRLDNGIKQMRALLKTSKERALPKETWMILSSGRRVVYVWSESRWFVESPKAGLVQVSGRKPS